MTDSPEHHRRRSEFIRRLVQRSTGQGVVSDQYAQSIPRVIMQYWHNTKALPDDVAECIDSWRRHTASGFRHHLFDERGAKQFIASRLGDRHMRAFGRCYHPAMQADYFRLCYIYVEGGSYIDADDVCVTSEIDWLFGDGRLRIQPLCYDTASSKMVTAPTFLSPGAYSPDWIFYVNNNPLIASHKHPVIGYALQEATRSLEAVREGELPEIQTTTGPGNLSKSIFDLSIASDDVENTLVLLKDWETHAISRWPLSYRNDARNWRHGNQQVFHGVEGDSK